MDGLKKIISEHTADQLAEYLFYELSTYETKKLFTAIEKFDRLIPKADYNSVRTVPIKGELTVTGDGIIGENNNFTITPDQDVQWFANQVISSSQIKGAELGVPKKTKINSQLAEELYSKKASNWVNMGYAIDHSYSAHDRLVKVYIRDGVSGEIASVGRAICSTKDEFDLNIGKLIAMYRATFGKKQAKNKLNAEGFGYLFN